MTTSPLDKAAADAREVLSKIEDVVTTLENDIASVADSAKTNLDDLYESSETLCREIIDTLQLPSNPVAIATIEAIDNLLAMLLQAKTHLEADELLAALGTFQGFDHHADDLKAAVRLTLMAQRRQK